MIRRSFIQTIAGVISAGLSWGRDKISDRRIPSPTGWDLRWNELPDSPTAYGAWMAVPQTDGRSVAFRTLVPRARGTERRVNIREVAVEDFTTGKYDGSHAVWDVSEDIDDDSYFRRLEDGGTADAVLYYKVWDIEKVPAPQSVLDAAKRNGRVRVVDLIKKSDSAGSIEDCCKAGLMPLAFADYYNADGMKKQIVPPGFMLTTSPAATELEQEARHQRIRDTAAASPLGVLMARTFSDLWRGCEYPQVIRCGWEAFDEVVRLNAELHQGDIADVKWLGLAEILEDRSIPPEEIWFENSAYPDGVPGCALYNRAVRLPL